MNDCSKWSFPFVEIEAYNSLVKSYLRGERAIEPLYNLFPSVENIQQQIQQKKNFPYRETLVKELIKQHQELELSQIQKTNLEQLRLENSFTICTGHQLNLLTGPAYFIAKILDVIKYCEFLKEKYANYNFIPVFWMATEDHDFDEINHFFYEERKVTWNPKDEIGGAVGRISTEGIMDYFIEFLNKLPSNETKNHLENIIRKSYGKSKNLAEGTRKLCHILFKELGLLIIDGDSSDLKTKLASVVEKELKERFTSKNVLKAADKINSLGYKVQVNPREINLFYLHPNQNLRERIIETDSGFGTLNGKNWTDSEIMDELKIHPEHFSPNSLLRPVYQEVILPNLAYVGGAAEASYWLQLKSTFDAIQLPFPMIIPRNSIFITSELWKMKAEKLGLSAIHFLNNSKDSTQYLLKESGVNDDFLSDYLNQLNRMFDELQVKAEETNQTFINMVNAQRTKQIKGLKKMRKRWWKAEEKRNQEKLNRYKNLKNKLLPNNKWQERSVNFFELSSGNYSQELNKIKDKLIPFSFQAHILTKD